MGIKNKNILLYLPWALPIVFISWFFIQKALGESKFKRTSYLYEISEQNQYLVKRVATGEEVDLSVFPMEKEGTQSSVYLDPSRQSVWFYFRNNKDKDAKGKSSFYWIQYDFEGKELDSLMQGDFPPSGGVTLANRMGDYVRAVNSERSPMDAKFFQFQSINWPELNPFRYGCSPNVQCKKRGPWKGMLKLRLLMPDGHVEFKVETTKANGMYTFRGHLYELPSHLTSNQLTVFYLQDTEHPELDKGLYFIYKK